MMARFSTVADRGSSPARTVQAVAGVESLRTVTFWTQLAQPGSGFQPVTIE